MPARRALLSCLLSISGAAALAGDGLQLPPPADVWPQWQARITVSTTTLAPVSLLGDYYLDAPGLQLPRALGGLRATGGLRTGARSLSLAMAGIDTTPDTLPYLGLGYSSTALKGGWGFTADIGLVAERPGRVLLGNGGVNNLLREMRLSPVVQLGVSYAF